MQGKFADIVDVVDPNIAYIVDKLANCIQNFTESCLISSRGP